MVKVIGLVGQAESGKTTAADMLVKEFGIPRFSFAEPIKEVCNPIAERLYGPDFDKSQVRWLYQAVGQGRREDSPDFWVNDAFERMKEFRYAVIDDVRYINEADRIRDEGGLIIRIQRTGHANRLTEEERSHPSEREMEDIRADVTLVNENLEQFLFHVRSKVVSQWMYGSVVKEVADGRR